MAERMAAELSEAGATVRIDREFPSSPSVIAELGTGDGPTIQWHGHLDAIDVEHAPPERNGDLLIGRGAADMKGPDAAMVAAIRVLRAHGLPGHGRVLVTLHGMHESGGNEPLHALIARGIHGDAVITGELGGGVELPIGGLGLSFWEIVVERDGTGDPRDRGHARDGRPGRGRAGPPRGPRRPARSPRGRLGRGPEAVAVHRQVRLRRLPEPAARAGRAGRDPPSRRDHGPGGGRGGAGGPGRRRSGGRPGRRSSCVSCRSPSPSRSIRRNRSSGRCATPIASCTANELRLTRGRVATNAVHFVQEAGIPAVGYGPDAITNHSDHEELAVSELSRIAGGFALASALYLERAAR